MVSGDTRFFQSQRKGKRGAETWRESFICVRAGEIAEWRAELQRTDLETQKLAVKKGNECS